ncbi:MAG: alginate export family protein [Planctomycetota bacterium]
MQGITPVLVALVLLTGGAAAASEYLGQPDSFASHPVSDGIEFENVAYLLDCGGDSCGDPLGCCDECGAGCGDACACNCAACQAKKKAAAPNPCLTSHKILFFNNDFSYLNDPGYSGRCLGDCLKLNPIGKNGQLSIGGQLRLRYHNEESMGFSTEGVVGGGGPGVGFQGTNEDFLLSRLRLYTDYRYKDVARLYVEGIFAENLDDGDTFLPRIIDRNYGDLLNVFADVNLTDSLIFRIGRQEHLYGAQRLLSPLDWANTRQRFEGIKFLYKKDDWAIDTFWTVFTPVDPDEFDEGDYNRRLYGVYATKTGGKYIPTLDLFYIGFDDTRALAPITSDFSLHTIGGRAQGGGAKWLYELEGGVQFGRQSGLGVDHNAGYVTGGVGRKFDHDWSPTMWFYYDYASGDDESGGFGRFNQLFPLAHKYLGFADFAQRANISSPNVLMTMQPAQKWKLLLWYYYLGAAESADIVPGVATNTAPLQNTVDDEFVHELDIIIRYQINVRSNILLGYSNVWAGDKLDDGMFPILDSDANFTYLQWEQNF